MRHLPATDDPAIPELDLQIDSTWVEHITNLEALSGALLGVGLIIAVGVVACAALAWAASLVFGFDLRSKFTKRMGAALIGAVALGSLAGIAGWGMGYGITT
ncbi:MAG TPA: hypothetical protein VGC67_11790 [Cellulomonas sp.]